MRLVFSNAALYNGKGTQLDKWASTLSFKFELEITRVKNAMKREKEKLKAGVAAGCILCGENQR